MTGSQEGKWGGTKFGVIEAAGWGVNEGAAGLEKGKRRTGVAGYVFLGGRW